MNSRDNTVSDSVSMLTAPMSRRFALRMIAGAGAAAVALAATGHAALGQSEAQSNPSLPYVARANLNLRMDPNTKAMVLLVIPKGGTVTLNGPVNNGYYFVNYNGTVGWAHHDYLVPQGASGHDPVITGTRKTTANVNLRSGPGGSYRVLRVIPSGTVVDSSSTVRNGYRYVVHLGIGGWVADSYRGNGNSGPIYDPNYATTTARLNLRAAPSLTAKVLLVIPSGAKVRLEASGSGQFRKVTYKGTTGWAAHAYLN